LTTRSLSCTYIEGDTPPGLPAEAEILGRAAGENFKVASRLLPAAARDHLVAFYGYARLTDQLGDSYEGDRLAALDWLEHQVVAAFDDGPSDHTHPIVARAVPSAIELGLTPQPFLDLIAANRQDQHVNRYATFDDLRSYCRLSADPVGRLVLATLGITSGAELRWSDSICTGLQLVEHWQDVAEDARAGRIYIPMCDLESFDIDADELSGGRQPSASLRALMAFEVARAREYLDSGHPLLLSLHGRARWAVAGFWQGGHSALDAIADDGFDVFTATPRARRWELGARTMLTCARLASKDRGA
jgi:squalene synthase HpnC